MKRSDQVWVLGVIFIAPHIPIAYSLILFGCCMIFSWWLERQERKLDTKMRGDYDPN